jgi:DNA-binding response OmpR family regulator
MMPGMSGLEVLTKIRQEGVRTPVLLLTAKAEIEDRIEGLDAGADDYLPKPFAMGELLARVRAMLRRREEYQPDLRTFGDLSLDSGSSELRCGSQKVVLPKVEYQMMDVLMLNHGIYLSSEDLLEKVWGYDTEADVGAVWVYISYLRKRIQTVGSSVKITAKRNIGYTLTY